MSREAKIIIYSVVLLFSIYLKFSYNIGDESSPKVNTERKSDVTKTNELNAKELIEKYSTDDGSKTNLTNSEKLKAKELIEKYSTGTELKELEKIYLVSYKSNGYSPYDSYFGKGVYNNSLDNSINVSAPKSSDIVFLLKNVYSGKTIRNEYIRKGTTFNLSGIPYGTYVFSYFSGIDWSDEITLKNGSIKGGFTKRKSFSKSEKIDDYMEFKDGYYGSYTIQLTEVVNGNLKTQDSNENEFFN